jgi:hypothetical protein
LSVWGEQKPEARSEAVRLLATIVEQEGDRTQALTFLNPSYTIIPISRGCAVPEWTGYL